VLKDSSISLVPSDTGIAYEGRGTLTVVQMSRVSAEPGKQFRFQLPDATQQENQILTTIHQAQTESKIESIFYAANNRSATWARFGPIHVGETAR